MHGHLNVKHISVSLLCETSLPYFSPALNANNVHSLFIYIHTTAVQLPLPGHNFTGGLFLPSMLKFHTKSHYKHVFIIPKLMLT